MEHKAANVLLTEVFGSENPSLSLIVFDFSADSSFSKTKINFLELSHMFAVRKHEIANFPVFSSVYVEEKRNSKDIQFSKFKSNTQIINEKRKVLNKLDFAAKTNFVPELVFRTVDTDD